MIARAMKKVVGTPCEVSFFEQTISGGNGKVSS